MTYFRICLTRNTILNTSTLMVRIGRNWVATTLIPVTHRTNTITVKVPALSPTMVKPMVILILVLVEYRQH